MPKVATKPKTLGSVVKKAKSRFKPLWLGPEVDGITQSMIGKWLYCRERFRIRNIIGLEPAAKFQPRLDYGNMWHECEEALGKGKPWDKALKSCANKMVQMYPSQKDEISKWYNVCKIQFPIYIEYWKGHKDVKTRKALYHEVSFEVPYELPSGRTILLRGKWDGVDLIPKRRKDYVWLQENKTKGDVDEIKIAKQLDYDLQVMLYLTALQTHLVQEGIKAPLAGVRYNVIKRPLSGGKGTIRQHKPTSTNPKGESTADYFKRLKGVIEEMKDDMFVRWEVGINLNELKAFQTETLNPLLDQICTWYDWIVSPEGIANPFDNPIHFRYPYGVYNPTLEGNADELDSYLRTKSTVGLQRADRLFKELA